MPPHNSSYLLSDQDSNLDRQYQKLQCYHYTIGQSGCKDNSIFRITKFGNKKLIKSYKNLICSCSVLIVSNSVCVANCF